MSTGTKRRRTASNAGSKAPTTNGGAHDAPLTRLNELLTDAITTAKAIKRARKDDPALQNAHKLANSLLKALPLSEVTALKDAGYNLHKASLVRGVKALEVHCRHDPIDGWEEQSEMMWDISGEIVKWLSELWGFMAEDEVDPDLVRSSLILCSNTVDSMRGCGSSSEYTDMSCKVKIIKSNGETVYEEDTRLDHSLAWMWRELFVFAASRKKPTKAILDNIRSLNIADDVLELIRVPEKQTSREDDMDLWDDHWSKAMKDSGARLRVALSKKK